MKASAIKHSPENAKGQLFPAFAILLLILSFSLRLWSFTQTPYANGWDSYFYLIQIKSLLEEGYMHSRDLSLIYPFMILIKLLIPDYILAYKVGAALLASFFSLCLYLLAYKQTKDYRIAVFLAAFSLFSPQVTYFAAQYPKNLFGLILLLLFIYWIDNWKLALLLLTLSFFGHRMTAMLTLFSGFIYYLLKFTNIKWIIIFALTAVVAILAGTLLPGIISIYDLERFQGVISKEWQLAPFSFLSTFGSKLVSGYWKAEIIFTSLLFFASWLYLILNFRNRNLIFLTVLITCTILILPFFQWNLEGMAFRFYLAFVLLVPVLLIFLLRINLLSKLLLPLATIPFALAFISHRSYVPQKQDPPYELYSRITNKAILALKEKSPELIIAHKSLAEYFTFKTSIDAMPWVPEYTLEESKLWRICTDIEPQLVRYYLSNNRKSVYYLGANYFLLQEKDWIYLVDELRKNEEKKIVDHLLSWRNPHEMRPMYLLKNK